MFAVSARRNSFVHEAARLATLACLLAPAVGCKSGSWGAKPSWMSFGQKAEDPAALTSAPTLAGDLQKPSATAKPYPTTSTPEGYSLPDATAQAAVAPGATPAAVTYGSTPPPAAATASTLAAAGRAPGIAPQVGPYATSAGATPPEASTLPSTQTPPAASWSSPALAAVPPAASSEPGPTISTASPPWASAPAAGAPAAAIASPAAAPPQPRYADARAASPEWTPAPLDQPAGEGRYAASGTSRFSSGASPTAASLSPATAPAATPFAAPPAELQPSAAPAAAPPSAPGAAPAAPFRRPDPGYRPGGTSSYRPAKSSLAADPPAGVMPASFEVPATAPN